MACGPELEARVHLRISKQDAPPRNVTTCFNGGCRSRYIGEVHVSTEAAEGWLVYSPPIVRDVAAGTRDGDRVRVAFTRADGSAVLDIERAVTYRTVPINGEGCGSCTRASLDLYETSAPGINCSGDGVASSVVLTKRIAVEDGIEDAILTVCRNKYCARTEYGLTRQSGPLTGALRAYLAVRRGEGFFDVTVRMSTEPALFADGDVYSLRVWNRKTQTLVTVGEKIAAYETTFPNGPECDPYPARKAVIDFD